MLQLQKKMNAAWRRRQAGFTLMELLIALAIFLVVSGIVMSGMVQLIYSQGTTANRTEMHTSVRSATELLQQEIGQAGRIALPKAVMPANITTAVTINQIVPTPQLFTVTVTPPEATNYMFPGMLLDVDTGANFEVVTVSAVGPGTITAWFSLNHNLASYAPNPFAPYPIQISGSFGTGIVPPDATATACATQGYIPYETAFGGAAGQGSNCSTLKLYGDINADGSVNFVEYTCVPGTSSQPGVLYRNEVFNAVVTGTPKPPNDASMILMSNVITNPNNYPCFNYRVDTATATVNGNPVQAPFVTDVAVTLTVQTQLQDPQTHVFQQETKALLNVSPRNVFFVWELSSQGGVPRNQPMPTAIAAILPN